MKLFELLKKIIKMMKII